MSKISIFWFRRDLRLEDNAGLYRALKGPNPVLPLFIFDWNILSELEDRDDARVTFIYDEISRLKKELQEAGGDLIVRYGKPENVWETLLQEYEVDAVYTNRDYEPYAKERDAKIRLMCNKQDVEFFHFKDQVIFDGGEVLKSDGDPYVVFTPYSRLWKKKLSTRMVDVAGEETPVSYYFQSYPSKKYLKNLAKERTAEIPQLSEMGFTRSSIEIPDKSIQRKLVKNYKENRNFPAVDGTSRLGIHFRFGTISIREKARSAQDLSETFLNELIWRDFYSMILDHFPKVVDGPFREKYEKIPWRNREDEFEKWCQGKTGYPIVDAGMRQLNQTGYMHNRVRMVVASFLTKHLLINWQWGEKYFARKLLDFDLASNNGGWQWAAGTGTDAAPYFRIFNPASQQQKFDKDKKYIKEWVPEFGTEDYPEPMVEHKMARERCLEAYGSV
ncbi:MAG: deoxyribodipyrimidine photo-lyase [Bacteroidetes bacterium]|nr:deoxyribodipyrimidine photo-lyase [Bacteroidota bacterium]